MKYLIIYAHPEPSSLSGYLKSRAVEALLAAGHEVIVSDLYEMRWKAVADRNDFPEGADTDGPLNYSRRSGEAFATGTQSPDVMEEQRKLLWADNVVVQFPIWWYGMPAILKGWVDRVYAYGFAYGIGPHGGPQWGKRFGEGVMSGRRAMIAMTVGGRMAHYGPRGVNGAMDDLLWPIQHGVLFYPGFTIVPPTVFYEVGCAKAAAIENMTVHYIDRLLTIANTDPVPLRWQNGGDYNDVQVLKPEFGGGQAGHALHQREPAFISNTWLGIEGDYTPQHLSPTSRTGITEADLGSLPTATPNER
ncbi:NAD(P)H-dependent oxidoreductase (plasmid) [Lichenicola cladoniae]|uniref:NAD(P)H-dependent oxidoreductase n=1 Tax=Lichenicola cladoniae TaxID=1484109 RepID=A0A6M8HXU2_9PROT|nr:NAD(P)H-dependent oxidoreductase [Lichenicola cladoniae]NPD70248.1 NAD(P)H-dependent oxidoreductase [Acetobacteraceae bacterium]QKE93374.1 NAD(P)H-dependent oxidoreductase [Lichenicola cladoniae]